MSLANTPQFASNPVSLAWTPPQSHHSHNHPPGTLCDGGVRFPELVGNPNGNESFQRGDITGEMSASVDLFSPLSLLATWNESVSKCDFKLLSFGADEEVALKTCLSSSLGNSVESEASLGDFLIKAVAEVDQRPKKAKKGGKQFVTIIHPGYFKQDELLHLLRVVSNEKLIIKNLFSRGMAAVTGFLYRMIQEKVDLKSILPSTNTNYSFILYCHVMEHGGTAYLDCSLVQCDSSEDAKKFNMLGYDRVCVLQSMGGTLTSLMRNAAEFFHDTVEYICNELLTLANVTQAECTAVLYDGLCGSSNEGKYKLPEKFLGKKAYRCSPHDAVCGGSILSAAELDSAKQYLRLDSGEWKLAFQLPIGDGSLQNGDIAVRTEWEPPGAAANTSNQASAVAAAGEAPKILFRSGMRLWKSEHGPIPPNTVMASKETVDMEFNYKGSLYGKSSSLSRGNTPKLHVLQRTRPEAEEWTLIKTIIPLLAHDSSSDKDEIVTKCTVTFSANPSTSVVEFHCKRGEKVSEVKKRHIFWVQLLAVILVPFLLVAAYQGNVKYQQYAVRREHTEWLTGFYAKHAPEKLADPQFITKTIDKYNNKMLVLWRNLEKTYHVKYAPPSSIVKGSD